MMTHSTLKFSFPTIIWLVSASVLLCNAPAFALSNLTILADSSASLAVSKLAREYAKAQDVAVSTSFTDKESQSIQILEGSAADILITSDTKWIDELQTQGLTDVYTKTEIGRGRMALVGPANSSLVMKLNNSFMAAPLVHAMNSEPALFLGNPEYVPEGKYAREALRSIGALSVLEPYTLYLKDYGDIIDQVTRNGGYAVIGYGQALLLDDVRIIDIFPESSEGMTYYAIVIAGDKMDEARKFLKYLTSKPARPILKNAGLVANAL